MKKLILITTTLSLAVFVLLFSLPNVSRAVPAAPSSTCAITAMVLDIQKTKTNIAGRGNPSREDFYYYAVKLKIEGSSVSRQEDINSCDNLVNKEQNSILSLVEYDKLPISAGQKITANLKYGGDGWFNGYFLSGIKITESNPSPTVTTIPTSATVGIVLIGIMFVGVVYKVVVSRKKTSYANILLIVLVVVIGLIIIFGVGFFTYQKGIVSSLFLKKPPIIDYFACSDYCPGPSEQYMQKIYQGVTDSGECLRIGGKPYTMEGWTRNYICEAK